MHRNTLPVLLLGLLYMPCGFADDQFVDNNGTNLNLTSPGNCIFTDGFETSPSSLGQLTNGGFECYSEGSNPPFEPPDDWLSFGVQIPFTTVGYNQFATQANDTPIYNPTNPGDQSNLFPGYMSSRALKMWGRNDDAGGGNFKHTLGTIYQEFSGGYVPAGSKLTLSGWAYVSSVDPLGSDSNVYLVIKCFPADFSAEYCGGGNGRKSAIIDDSTTEDNWTHYSVTVESLDDAVTVVQPGLEFEQCSLGDCPANQGSIFWDEIQFSWE